MTWTLHQGDCVEALKALPDGSVHCCVTSPPYLGLRDYGCEGQLGLEKTPAEYVVKMVEVFREVRRVLRDDGTLWLNLGDSYADVGRNHQRRAKDAKGVVRPASVKPCERCGAEFEGGLGRRFCSSFCGGSDNSKRGGREGRLKHKDLLGVPWRVAFALQDDGWTLRQDIIWAKPNPMPESVRDRCTKAHEYVFLLAKSARYYYDADAVREPLKAGADHDRPRRFDSFGQTSKGSDVRFRSDGVTPVRDSGHVMRSNPAGRNRRSVWTVPTKPFKGAHFAVMPPALVEPCVKAGTSERGCCPACGAPWLRMVERTRYQPEVVAEGVRQVDGSRADKTRKLSGREYNEQASCRTTGWRPACDCPPAKPVPCTVLDPFAGAGTVGAVALSLGRSSVLVELNPDYCDIIRKRMAAEESKHPLFAEAT